MMLTKTNKRSDTMALTNASAIAVPSIVARLFSLDSAAVRLVLFNCDGTNRINDAKSKHLLRLF
jgi:hypothetical protein